MNWKPWVIPGVALAVCAGAVAYAASGEPGDDLRLTGRVVDTADVVPAAAEKRLNDKLAAYEERTRHQIVVVTTKSLEGSAIDDYSVRLFNRWGIGRKGFDDGIGLLVAPSERSVRIEVGKGLETKLTDSRAAAIIETAIIPRFSAGDLPGGVEAGVDAIIGTMDCVEHDDCVTTSKPMEI